MKGKKASMHGFSEHEGSAWGRGEFANMPQEKVMKPYSKAHMMKEPLEDDTMTRIDEEVGRSESRARSHYSDQH